MIHLRQRRTYRRPKGAAALPGGHIVDAVSLRERPATVEDRAVPGHWEGDLLVGARQSYVATSWSGERATSAWSGSPKRDADGRAGRSAALQRLPAGLMATLTWDRGLELQPIAPSRSRRASRSTSVTRRVRGSAAPMRTTNGLLRQYLPKGPTSPATPRPSSMRLPCGLTLDHVRRSGIGRRRLH